MRSILLIIFCVVFHVTSHAQVMENPDKAFALAQQTRKNVLLIFSGSDWCIPCIQLNKQVLSDSSFLHFADDHLVLLEADFPQRKKIAPPLRRQYDSLAAAFNPEGAFPEVVLLSPDKKLLAHVPSNQPTPARFIAALKQLLQ